MAGGEVRWGGGWNEWVCLVVFCEVSLSSLRKFPWSQEGWCMCLKRVFNDPRPLIITATFCQHTLLHSKPLWLHLAQLLPVIFTTTKAFFFLALVSSWPKRISTMSSIMKVFLLLAVMFCISQAQRKCSYVLLWGTLTETAWGPSCWGWKKDLFSCVLVAVSRNLSTQKDLNEINFFPLFLPPDNETGQQCLCRRVRNAVGSKDEIKDIQIYPATIFCDKVEIV